MNEKLTDCYGTRYDPKGKFCAVCVVSKECQEISGKKRKPIKIKEVREMKTISNEKTDTAIPEKTVVKKTKTVALNKRLVPVVKIAEKFGYKTVVFQKARKILLSKEKNGVTKKLFLGMTKDRVKVRTSFPIKNGRESSVSWAKKLGLSYAKTIKRPKELFEKEE